MAYKEFTRHLIIKADALGGIDPEDWQIDNTFNNIQYYDKGGHLIRAINNHKKDRNHHNRKARQIKIKR